MKKIQNYKSTTLSPIKIYWDELEEIHSRMANGREIKITSQNYEYKSLNELKEKNKKGYIEEIQIVAHGKSFSGNDITLQIEPGKIWLFESGESTETAAKIREILKGSSPWFMSNSFIWKVIGMFFWSSFMTFIIELYKIKVDILLILFCIAIEILFFALMLKDKPLLGKGIIYLSLKKDHVSFWELHKGQIYVNTFSGITGTTIGFLLGYFFGK